MKENKKGSKEQFPLLQQFVSSSYVDFKDDI